MVGLDLIRLLASRSSEVLNVDQICLDYFTLEARIIIILRHLVFAISTGMEAAVVTRPDIIDAQKCRKMFSEKYPVTRDNNIVYCFVSFKAPNERIIPLYMKLLINYIAIRTYFTQHLR